MSSFDRLLKRDPPSPSADVVQGRARAAAWRELFEQRGLVWTQKVLVPETTANVFLAEAERLHDASARAPRASHTALLESTITQEAAAFLANGCVPAIELQPSTNTRGLGVFASAPLPMHTIIGNYTGELRFVDDVTLHGDYAFEAWPDTPVAVDAATHGNHTRFVNHAAQPNIGVVQCVVGREWHVLYATLRAIDQGEELLVDYGREYWRRRRVERP